MSFLGTFVYLHGFKSSPQSIKAQLVVKSLEERRLKEKGAQFAGKIWVPDLGFDIREGIRSVESALEHLPAPFVFMGSSLGGYYATYLSERSPIVLARSPQSKVVLINPSVKPFALLQDYLGWVGNLYTKERFEVKLEYMEILKQYYVENISYPERYFLLAKTHDEVLDYWQAVHHYRGCHMMVEAGGNHSFENLDQYLDSIFEFFGIGPAK